MSVLSPTILKAELEDAMNDDADSHRQLEGLKQEGRYGIFGNLDLIASSRARDLPPVLQRGMIDLEGCP
jgi:hypothetical protein